ncbi:MAG TPA: FAD-dependent oxidoreductase, partial [Thiolinea sp.]|nr:FAD-dependent oxidoreductase [Thiolinea sp.]
LRYDPLFVLRHAGWFRQFLSQGRADNTEPRARALHALISRSQVLHREWLNKAGAIQRLRTNGWLQVYRRPESLAGTQVQAGLLDRFGIAHEFLSTARLRALEPALKPVFAGGWWIRDTASVDSPGAVVDAYTRRYRQLQGVVREGEVRTLTPQEDHWQVHFAGGPALEAQQVVVALGPWSRTFLQPLGLRLPMLYERGSHRHFEPFDPAVCLQYPVYDVDGAYVISPMEAGLRLTCGVELAARDAPHRLTQLNGAERMARQALALGERVEGLSDWLGARPVLPDSLPAIGPTRLPGLWLNTGHQHIGFSAAPASAELLANLMLGRKGGPDPTPYLPERFGLG